MLLLYVNGKQLLYPYCIVMSGQSVNLAILVLVRLRHRYLSTVLGVHTFAGNITDNCLLESVKGGIDRIKVVIITNFEQKQKSA